MVVQREYDGETIPRNSGAQEQKAKCTTFNFAQMTCISPNHVFSSPMLIMTTVLNTKIWSIDQMAFKAFYRNAPSLCFYDCPEIATKAERVRYFIEEDCFGIQAQRRCCPFVRPFLLCLARVGCLRLLLGIFRLRELLCIRSLQNC